MIVNRIYALKDRDPAAALTETDLVDVTQNLVQDGTSQEQAATLADLDGKDGWYTELNENPGEKVLAPGVAYFGVVYLTTFTPTPGSPIDPCYVGAGTGRPYALDYEIGAAEIDFDDNDVLDKSDRSMVIGPATPSGMVIAIIQGKATSVIGVGGGIFSSEMAHSAAITRTYWRQSAASQNHNRHLSDPQTKELTLGVSHFCDLPSQISIILTKPAPNATGPKRQTAIKTTRIQ